MTPIPYSHSGERRPENSGAGVAFKCPTCDGTLSRSKGSLSCGACGFVPRHGAD